MCSAGARREDHVCPEPSGMEWAGRSRGQTKHTWCGEREDSKEPRSLNHGGLLLSCPQQGLTL